MPREAMVEPSGGSMGSRSLLRRMNSLGVLRALLPQPLTLRELADASGLSRTAIDAIVTDLVEMGWLESVERASASRVGRPATAFSVRATHSSMAVRCSASGFFSTQLMTSAFTPGWPMPSRSRQ